MKVIENPDYHGDDFAPSPSPQDVLDLVNQTKDLYNRMAGSGGPPNGSLQAIKEAFADWLRWCEDERIVSASTDLSYVASMARQHMRRVAPVSVAVGASASTCYDHGTGERIVSIELTLSAGPCGPADISGGEKRFK